MLLYVRGAGPSGEPIEAEVEAPDDIKVSDTLKYGETRVQIMELRKSAGPGGRIDTIATVAPLPEAPRFENPFEPPEGSAAN